jgi:hypothetical protein
LRGLRDRHARCIGNLSGNVVDGRDPKPENGQLQD